MTLANGDRFTGEVVRLERGRLEFKTDDVGTLYIEWDKVVSVEAAREFEVATSDGARYLGRLTASTARSLGVAGVDGTATLLMREVTFVTPIGTSVWRRIDGALDVGFSYTQSSGIAQLNVNSETLYRQPKFEGRLAVSVTSTMQKAENVRDDRGSVDASYVRYAWPRWFVSAAGRVESNESLGLSLRTQVAAATGPRLVNTNRALLLMGGGLVVNDERRVDADAVRNVEAILLVRGAYFTYDRPRTTLDLTLQAFPSLSDRGRWRAQLDTAAKRELFKDVFVSVNVFETYDSRTAQAGFQNNDFGIVLSLGVSY